MDARGTPAADLFTTGAFFWRFALGGVFDKSESSSTGEGSPSVFSMSDSGLGLFLMAALGFKVVCAIFFAAAFGFGAVVDLGGAAFSFALTWRKACKYAQQDLDYF